MRRFMLLTEIHRVQTLLLENRIDTLRSKYNEPLTKFLSHASIPPKIRRKITDASGNIDANLLFNLVLMADPDPTKKNTQWVLNLIVANRMPLEDIEKVPGYLSKWMEKKKKRDLPPEAMDLGRFKSLGDLFAAISDSDTQMANADDAELAEIMQQSKVWMDTSHYLIVSPLTTEAAQFWGRGTEWCTAWGDPKGKYANRTSQFLSGQAYGTKGYVYVIIDKTTNNRWQFQIESNQYMDVNDREISLRLFADKHPEVEAFFDSFLKISEEDIEVLPEWNGTGVYKVGSKISFDMEPPITSSFRDLNRTRSDPLMIWYVDEHDPKLIVGGSTRSLVNVNKIVARRLQDYLIENNYRLKMNISLFADNDLFFNDGVWGSMYDIGKTVLTDSHGGEINMLVGDNVYAEYRNEGIVAPISIKDGAFLVDGGNVWDITNRPKNDDARKIFINIIGKFIIGMIKKIRSFAEESHVHMNDLDYETQAIIINKKPSLATALALLKIKGPNDPATIEKMFKLLDGEYNEGYVINHTTDIIDGKVIMEKFRDINQLLKYYGGDDAGDLLDVIENGIEYSGDAENSGDSQQMFLGSLKDSLLKRLGEYMQRTYSNEIEEYMDGNFDPTNVNDIIELQSYVDDDELNSAFHSATVTGYERGASSQAFRLMKQEMDLYSRCVYALIDGKLVSGFHFDTPYCIAVGISELIETISNVGKYDELSETGWGKTDDTEIKIDPTFPHYGFDDYDDKAADEYFAERIHEMLDAGE